METKPRLLCCLCSGLIEVQQSGYAGGHNAEPLAQGRCCSVCNDTLVVPMRIQTFIDAAKAKGLFDKDGNNEEG